MKIVSLLATRMLVGCGLVGCGLVGCGQAPPPVTPFKAVHDVAETMVLVLDPAADVIWGSAGAIITIEGTEELAPTTDEGWLAVAHSAAVVAETGNLLMMPSRARDDADWIEIARGLVDAGIRAKQAAEAHDADALFTAGGNLYNVCVSCHQLYWVGQTEPPI